MPYRESVDASWWFQIACLGAGVIAIAVGVYALVSESGGLGERLAGAAAGMIGGGIIIGVLVLFRRVRVEVDRDAVRIDLGPAGRTVTRDELAAAEVTPYRWWRYGGWGLRIRWGGRRAYTVPFRRQGVTILTADGHEIYVNSGQPQRLHSALLSLMGRQKGAA